MSDHVPPGSATPNGGTPDGGAVRSLLHTTAERAPHARIDAGAVLARSRRRRFPRQLAASGVGVLAIAGIGFAGVNVLQGVAPVSVLSNGAPASEAGPETQGGSDMQGGSGGGESSSGADSGSTTLGPGAPGSAESGAVDGGTRLAPAEKINLCGGTLAELAPAQSGLVATPQFPAAALAGTGFVSGSVTVTNTGTERVTGYTGASPAMTLSQNGITLWHSNGPQIALAQLIDLEPGASMELPASVTPVRCEIEDDAAGAFRENLPALPAGEYHLSAVFYLIPEGDATALPSPDVVSGPVATITLR